MTTFYAIQLPDGTLYQENGEVRLFAFMTAAILYMETRRIDGKAVPV